MILITGARGSVGKTVLQEAIRKESKVRAMYRSKEEAAKGPLGCAPVRAGFADNPSLRNALDGVTSVFVVCSPVPQLVEFESNMVDACKECGVNHVVLNSALRGSPRTPCTRPPCCSRIPQVAEPESRPQTRKSLRPERCEGSACPNNPPAPARSPRALLRPLLLTCTSRGLWTLSGSLPAKPFFQHSPLHQ